MLRGVSRSTAAAPNAGATQGLAIAVNLRMASVPTAIYHLLEQEQQPLVECQFKHGGMGVQRLRVTATIEHYAATAVKLVRLSPGESVTVGLSPTLLPERLQAVNELTRVTLTIAVENVTRPGEPLVEEHKSLPLWLLARNAAPLAVRDPVSGQWMDMSRYMGAFVTPNTPAVMRFLRSAAQHHPDKRLTGYQSDPIEPQVEAIFAALKAEGQITYVNSVIAFNPEQSARSQRVRLPRECLAEQQANCIDGTVLFASLLEAASLNPALVIVPGHALVGWQADPTNQPQLWNYLETTMIGSHDLWGSPSRGRAACRRLRGAKPGCRRPQLIPALVPARTAESVQHYALENRPRRTP